MEDGNRQLNTRVNILIIDNSNSFTGAFKCALQTALLLSEKHHFIFVIPSESTNGILLGEKGFTVYQLPMKEMSRSIKSVAQYPFYLSGNLWKLRKIVTKEKIDIVQVNDFYNLLGAGLKMSGTKIKLLTYVRFLPSSLPNVLRNMWTKTAQRYSDKVIAVSDAVLHQLPEKINTIKLYDAAIFEEKINGATASREHVVFLYLANFTRGKGQEHALAAFKKLYDTHKNIRLKYVGGFLGLEKNRLFKDELQHEVKQLQLDPVVSFHEFDKNVEQLIKDSNVLLNFSEAESFSMTCLEASYYGIPVIAAKCGGPEEIIVNEQTGILVEKKDIAGMAAAMSRLAEDKNLREQYGAAARNYVREKFSKEQFLQQFHRLLNGL